MKIVSIITSPGVNGASVRFGLFSIEECIEETIAKGSVEGIGSDESTVVIWKKDEKITRKTKAYNVGAGVVQAIETILSPELCLIEKERDITAVGHRILHGGERFKENCFVDEKVIDGLMECIPLAPLHNPYSISGIETISDILKGIPQIAVFDTCFHYSLPDYAYIYGIPYEYYMKYGIRRYGFHGTSHEYMAGCASRLIGKPLTELKLVTCHLSDGASVTAIKGGKSIDTSMGFTPLEGLLMSTRPGDIDAYIIPYIMQRDALSAKEIASIINRKSGLIGISSISSDIIELVSSVKDGSYRAKLAVDVYCYRLKKYISSYIGVMGGVDAIMFSGNIGEKCPYIRAHSLKDLDFMGIKLDEERNKADRGESEISEEKSPVKIYIIPDGGLLMIAREVYNLMKEVK